MAACATSVTADPVNLTRPSPSNTYFNKPGTDMAAHDAELRECLLQAARTSQPGLYGGGGPGTLASFLVGVSESTTGRANAENCMVVRGWRVVQIPEDEASAIQQLDRVGQAEKLKGWVGAVAPHGQIIRQWANDGATAATTKMQRGPLFGKANLSFTASDRIGDGTAPTPAPAPEVSSLWNLTEGNGTELKPEELDKATADQAIIVLDVKGSGPHNGDTLVFRRMGPDPNTSPRVADKLADKMWAYDNWVWNSKGKWYAFAVPPGRWRIEMLTEIGDQYRLNFCLGSPAFEVKAGEVIYAGTFDSVSGKLRSRSRLGPCTGLARRQVVLCQPDKACGVCERRARTLRRNLYLRS